MTTQSFTESAGKRRLSGPAVMLRLEGLALLILSVVLYRQQEFGWLAFALLLLAPDLAALGYLHSKRTGAVVYNLAHNILAPLLLGAAGLLLPAPLAVQLSLIWLAHIGMDRMFGYGFKYGDSFKRTHLQGV